MVVQNKAIRPVISNSLGNRISMAQIEAIFITKLDNPKVKILIGNEAAWRIGFMK